MSRNGICTVCLGKGYVWDRNARVNRPCTKCNGTGSGLAR